jgi:uncharacterized spore protein YtfJ
MENNKSFETLTAYLAQEITVKKVYGEPVVTQGKTIIPVAKIVMGMGTGTGKKHNSIGNAKVSKEKGSDADTGSGSGGGAIATPQGVFEITENRTRYIPANAAKFFILGGVIGAVIGGFLLRKRVRYNDKKKY